MTQPIIKTTAEKLARIITKANKRKAELEETIKEIGVSTDAKLEAELRMFSEETRTEIMGLVYNLVTGTSEPQDAADE